MLRSPLWNSGHPPRRGASCSLRRAGVRGWPERRGAGGAGGGAQSTHATSLLAPAAFALPGKEGFFNFRCFACGIPKNAVNMQGGLFLSELAISVINLILSKS